MLGKLANCPIVALANSITHWKSLLEDACRCHLLLSYLACYCPEMFSLLCISHFARLIILQSACECVRHPGQLADVFVVLLCLCLLFSFFLSSDKHVCLLPARHSVSEKTINASRNIPPFVGRLQISICGWLLIVALFLSFYAFSSVAFSFLPLTMPLSTFAGSVHYQLARCSLFLAIPLLGHWKGLPCSNVCHQQGLPTLSVVGPF